MAIKLETREILPNQAKGFEDGFLLLQEFESSRFSGRPYELYMGFADDIRKKIKKHRPGMGDIGITEILIIMDARKIYMESDAEYEATLQRIEDNMRNPFRDRVEQSSGPRRVAWQILNGVGGWVISGGFDYPHSAAKKQ